MKTLLHFFLLLFPGFVFGDENDNPGSIRGVVFTSDGYPAAYVSVMIKNTGKELLLTTMETLRSKK